MCCNRYRRRRVHQRCCGFSLIEVMIVVVIIGLLAGAVTLSTRHFLDKAKQTRARSDIATYKSAIESFYADESRYPTNDEALGVLTPKFIDKLRMDPWGRPYQYNFPGRSGPYEILCFGADGRDGGEGVNADISSEDADVAAAAAATAAKQK
jgi:general secretion pathway protein G